jgi:hypothetical protein
MAEHNRPSEEMSVLLRELATCDGVPRKLRRRPSLLVLRLRGEIDGGMRGQILCGLLVSNEPLNMDLGNADAPDANAGRLVRRVEVRQRLCWSTSDASARDREIALVDWAQRKELIRGPAINDPAGTGRVSQEQFGTIGELFAELNWHAFSPAPTVP